MVHPKTTKLNNNIFNSIVHLHFSTVSGPLTSSLQQPQQPRMFEGKLVLGERNMDGGERMVGKIVSKKSSIERA
jgi:hypothetical protein